MVHQKKRKGKVFISACLLGHNVRYNQIPIKRVSSILDFFQKQELLIPLCPEIEGGLQIPRSPSEIQNHRSNQKECGNVVKNVLGEDLSEAFQKGANNVLTVCLEENCKMAILKERSPSCGVNQIYDGSFTGELISGSGKTTGLLKNHGIKVFSEEQLEDAYRFWFFSC